MAIEYQKGNSLLHRLDARTKILLFAIATMLAVVIIDPILMALIFLGLYGLGRRAVKPKELNKNLRVLVVIFLTFSLFQIIFFTPENAHFLFYLLPSAEWSAVTIEGIVRAAAVFFRFFSVVLAVHLLLYTTPPVDMVLAFTRRSKERNLSGDLQTIGLLVLLFTAGAYLAWPDRIRSLGIEPSLQAGVVILTSLAAAFFLHRLVSRGLPPEMGVALMLGFATVGILSQQTQKITDAQKARGYDVQPKNIFRRVQVLTALLIPIFLATLERSQDISVAILARAFDFNIGARTYRRQLVFRREDIIFLVVVVALLFIGLAMNTAGIGNPTEQFVLNLLAGPTP